MGKSKRPLTITQESAINLLVIGNTQDETARALGLSPSLISQWVNHSKAFKSELAARKKQMRPGMMPQAYRHAGLSCRGFQKHKPGR